MNQLRKIPIQEPFDRLSPRRLDEDGPMLRFTPTAWAKLQYFCHRGKTEIGGFGLARTDDLLLVEEFLTVRQSVSAVTVAFDDTAVADLFENQVDAGHKPEQFARIWLHTHPGDSPTPSMTDEETFARVFGSCDWTIMFILARGGATYARLRFNVGPGGEMLIPVAVDYRQPFAAADHAGWEAEYQAHVQVEAEIWGLTPQRKSAAEPAVAEMAVPPARSRNLADDLLADLEAMEPAERIAVMDELASRPDLWADDDGLVVV